MSDQLIFRGAYFRHAVIQDDESGVFVRAHVTADLSDPVCEQMGWNIGEGGEGGDLKGRLEGEALTFIPNDPRLSQHELNVICSEVASFQWKECKDKGEESTHFELRFVVRLPGEGAAALIENYKRRIGKEPSQLRIAFRPNEQGQIDLQPAKGTRGEDGPCIDCNNRVPMMDGSTTVHASGQPCRAVEQEKPSAGPALAPAALMGGTHAKESRSRRNRQPRSPEREGISDGTTPLDEELPVEEEPAGAIQ